MRTQSSLSSPRCSFGPSARSAIASLIAASSLGLLAVGNVAGCGSSSDPRQNVEPTPSTTTSADTGVPPPPPPPAIRALKTGSLLPTSPRNLVLDPGLSQNPLGWGHFFVNYESGAGAEVDYTLRTESASPAGVSSPIGVFMDSATTATDDKSRGMRLLSAFLGGPGPYHVEVWITQTDRAGNPIELKESNASVSISTNTSSKTYDIPRTETTQVFGTRTWTLFSATLPNALAGGGFFHVRLGKLGGGFLVTAPQVVPDALKGDTTKSFTKMVVARATTPEESAAIVAYQHRPIALFGAQSLTDKKYPLPPR